MRSYSDVPEEFEVSMSWPSAIKELLLFKKAEGYTEGTLKGYKSSMKLFSEYCVAKGYMSPANVPKRAIREFQADMNESHTVGYCNAHLSRIRAFYGFLCDEGDLPEYADPTRRLKMAEVLKKKLIIFNDEEVLQFIEAAGNQKNKFFAARDKLLIMMMADAGLRVREMVSLQDKEVTDEYIFVKKGKGNKQRMVYCSPAVAKEVIRYKRVRNAYFDSKNIPKNGMLFRNRNGGFLKNDGVQKMLKKLATVVDVRADVRVSPHTFRHYFAQSQLKNGCDILTLSRLLGHSNINTTQIYLEGLADEELVQSAISTSPLMNLRNRQK